MSRLVVIGSGGHARVLVSIARRDRIGELIGYVDRQDRGPWNDLPYLGDDAAIRRDLGGVDLLFGVGLVRNAADRWRLYAEHRAAGARSVVLVSSRACVAAEARLDAGTVVLDLAAVNAGAVLGELCIVNTGAVVEHDCRLGRNVHVAPRATLCGEVVVGDHCLIGAGAVVLPAVKIASGITVGAGAVVVRDLDRPGAYAGAPAVPLRRGGPA
ncbi:MAG TPA: NeuD/PglB/VioB family sugar acetyltransferase [Candidatus Krumholzibacteria bacterium]|nr:NeuD/PglB/VioB family sugar acetyltransferase [Candidatus Krumholzibacteria bacterium]HPD70985.1 NeuD/PglB/VioB family sugar acetyltransferase [Candidatus Krumholzibacteria bacterium]HRY39315.1 NeuD/PglB/VioB family sugar acetyltransferase [Candidatus Krumholzibacteria bacterium]